MRGDQRTAMARTPRFWRWRVAVTTRARRQRHRRRPSRRHRPPPLRRATPEVTILNKHEVEGILGREVRSAADENMGRIVDVLVDRAGQVRAAIIDFGGFLGVGSRKIAVDWSALHFPPPGKPGARIALELPRPSESRAGIPGGQARRRSRRAGKLEPLPE